MDTFHLNINYQQKEGLGFSYLIAAVVSEKWSLIEPLLQRGIDVNLRDGGGATALMHAALCGHLKAIKLLLAKGADPLITNTTGETAFEIAYFSGRLFGPLLCKNTQEEDRNFEEVINLLDQAIEEREKQPMEVHL